MAEAQANNPATGTVEISVTTGHTGTAEIFETLTAEVVDAVDADGLMDVAYTYRWFYPADATTCATAADLAAGTNREITLRTGVFKNTLIVTRSDYNKQICVVVEFEDDLGNAESLESDATSKVPSGAQIDTNDHPANPMNFSFFNTAVVGSILKVNTDEVNYPDLAATPGYTYQWIHWGEHRAGPSRIGDITGATGSTYTVRESDYGKYISLGLTFSCDTSFDSCSSGTRTTFANSPTNFIEIPDVTVTLNFNSFMDEVVLNTMLTATQPNVPGVANPGYEYYWYAVPVGEELSLTDHFIPRPTINVVNRFFRPTVADIGKNIVVIMEYEDDFFGRYSATSAPVGPVASGPVIVPPSTGYYWDDNPETDNYLFADTSEMTYSFLPGGGPERFIYQWIYVDEDGGSTGAGLGLADGDPSNMKSYALTSVDNGKYLQVRVTFDVDGADKTFKANAQTPLITLRPTTANTSVTVASEGFTGEVDGAEVGKEVTATVSGYDGVAPEYRYSWYAAPEGVSITEHPIPGASDALSNTYTPTAAEIGKSIVVIARIRNDFGADFSVTSAAIGPVPNGPEILLSATAGGYYWDDNPQTKNYIFVDTSEMTYSYLPGSPERFTYNWIYVEENGNKARNAHGVINREQYDLKYVDELEGLHLQVQVTFADSIDGTLRTVFGNMKTPLITKRPPIDSATNLTATVARGGGSVTLEWDLTALGGEIPRIFQYRYRPGAATYAADSSRNWDDTPRITGGQRRVVITEPLINNVEYTFEVRSVSSVTEGLSGAPDTATETYLHVTRDCP